MPKHFDEVRLTVGEARPKHIPVHKVGPRVAFQLHDFEQVDLTVEALDAEGNPADASISWASSDETIVALSAASGNTVTAIASPGTGGLGAATVTVTATDNSDGDVTTATFDIEVVAGDVATINVVPGTPAPKS